MKGGGVYDVTEIKIEIVHDNPEDIVDITDDKEPDPEAKSN